LGAGWGNWFGVVVGVLMQQDGGLAGG